MSGPAFPRPSPRIPPGLGDRRELRLPPDPTSASRARAFVVENCPYGGELRDAARLLVSELVTNVILHARTPMTIGVASGERTLLLTVTDGDDSVPRVSPDHGGDATADPTAEGGRGLTLMRLLSEEYGVTQHETGKTVWTLLRQRAD